MTNLVLLRSNSVHCWFTVVRVQTRVTRHVLSVQFLKKKGGKRINHKPGMTAQLRAGQPLAIPVMLYCSLRCHRSENKSHLFVCRGRWKEVIHRCLPQTHGRSWEESSVSRVVGATRDKSTGSGKRRYGSATVS